MTAHPERKPDALDLAETLAIAASDIRTLAWVVAMDGVDPEMTSLSRESARGFARAAANRVLAAHDAYEART